MIVVAYVYIAIGLCLGPALQFVFAIVGSTRRYGGIDLLWYGMPLLVTGLLGLGMRGRLTDDIRRKRQMGFLSSAIVVLVLTALAVAGIWEFFVVGKRNWFIGPEIHWSPLAITIVGALVYLFGSLLGNLAER